MIIQVLLILLILFAWSRVLVRLRGQEVSWHMAALWTLFWLAATVAVLWPDLLSRVALVVNVGRGVDVAVYLAFLVAFYLFFRIFVRLDRIEQDITKLTRHAALKGNQHSGLQRSDDGSG